MGKSAWALWLSFVQAEVQSVCFVLSGVLVCVLWRFSVCLRVSFVFVLLRVAVVPEIRDREHYRHLWGSRSEQTIRNKEKKKANLCK